MRSLTLTVLPLLLLLLLPLIAAESRKTLAATAPDSKIHKPICAGCYEPIKNVSSPHIQHVGKFAVHEHNKETTSSLEFPEVFAGESQVTDGVNYKLKLFATNGGLRQKYLTFVYEDLNKKLHLVDFALIHHS